jgi:hypothetical protein
MLLENVIHYVLTVTETRHGNFQMRVQNKVQEILRQVTECGNNGTWKIIEFRDKGMGKCRNLQI